jgi:cell division protein FtsZ
VHQAFAAADVTVSQSLRSIVSLIQRPGLIRIGFDDLLSALQTPNSRCLFGYGESESENRAHDALTQALKNPLMDRGRLLEDAASLLVQIAGGPGMTLSEVEILMHELNRHLGDNTQILFGTAVDGRMGNRLAVTLISSLSADGAVVSKTTRREPAEVPAPPQPHVPTPKREPKPAAVVEHETESAAEGDAEEELMESPPILQRPLQTIEAVMPNPELSPRVALEEEVAPETQPEPQVAASTYDSGEPLPEPEPEARTEPPRVILPKKKPSPIKEPKAPVEKTVQAKQEVLQFESVTRGRFEKSEPTIVEGQDLDVPTFLRKNVRVK